jgi:hypothetical protein
MYTLTHMLIHACMYVCLLLHMLLHEHTHIQEHVQQERENKAILHARQLQEAKDKAELEEARQTLERRNLELERRVRELEAAASAARAVSASPQARPSFRKDSRVHRYLLTLVQVSFDTSARRWWRCCRASRRSGKIRRTTTGLF